MRRFPVAAFGLTGVFAIGVCPAFGQTNAPVVQSNSHGAASHGARASAAHPVAPASQNVARGPNAFGPRIINSQHPVAMPGHSPVTSRPNYSALTRPLNPALAEVNARQNARTYDVQPTANMEARNEFAPRKFAFPNNRDDAGDRDVQSTAPMLPRRQPPQDSLATTPRTFEAQSPSTTHQATADAVAPPETLHSRVGHTWKDQDNRLSFSDAHHRHWREWHDRNWWCQHFSTIVLVSTGYYFLDGSYWYPAFGYDPLNSYYDYDGPVYTYGNLLPDEVIANVQTALQDAGYYFGPITGSLSVETRAALANFQRDYGLPITGAIDQPTIETLGLY